jgi:hypothetical protein
VKVTPEVQQIFTLTARFENDAQDALTARKDALALVDKLKARPQSASTDALIAKLSELAGGAAPVAAGGRGGRGGAAAAATSAPTLNGIGAQMVASLMSMQASEMPPTAAELEACATQEAAYNALMQKWSALKTAASPAQAPRKQ